MSTLDTGLTLIRTASKRVSAANGDLGLRENAELIERWNGHDGGRIADQDPGEERQRHQHVHGDPRRLVLGDRVRRRDACRPEPDEHREAIPRSPRDQQAASQAEGEEDGEHSDRRRIKADPKAPFAGLAFKIINDKYGTLTFVRVYSGTLKSGDTVLNTTKDHKERIGRMVRLQADKREDVKDVYAGEIAAFVGMKEVKIGHTVCTADHPIALESIGKQAVSYAGWQVPIRTNSAYTKARIESIDDQRVRQEAQYALADAWAVQTLSIPANGSKSELARLHAIWALGQIARNPSAAAAREAGG